MTRVTPEAISDAVRAATESIVPFWHRQYSSPDQAVFRTTHPIGDRLPGFPTVFVPCWGQEVTGGQVEVIADRANHHLVVDLTSITNEDLRVAAAYQVRPDGSVVLSPSPNVSKSIIFSPRNLTVGFDKEQKGQQHALLLAITPDDVQFGDSTPRIPSRIIRVGEVLLPMGWQEAIRADGRLMDPREFRSIQSGQDVAEMLTANPPGGFSALQEKAEKLPAQIREIRFGYSAGHNDNPARVTASGSEIKVRFLYANIGAIAGMIQAGTLNLAAFLKEGLLSKAPKHPDDTPDDIELSVKLEKGSVQTSVAITCWAQDGPEGSTKRVREDSEPFLKDELDAAGIDYETFASALQECLGTPQAVGELFATLRAEKEAVALSLVPTTVIPDFNSPRVTSTGGVRGIESGNQGGGGKPGNKSSKEKPHGSNEVGSETRPAGSRNEKKDHGREWQQRKSPKKR